MRLRFLLVAALLAGCSLQQATPTPPTEDGPTPPTASPPRLRLEPFLAGFTSPVHVLAPPDASGRLFVVEQGGLVKVVRDGRVLDEPFLDARNLTAAGGERGLLGLAFHPGFAENGAVLASYTDTEGDSVLARYHVDPLDPDRLDPESAETLLTVAQPFANHNGGHVVFGPDGFLYYGLGDGGAAGDPFGNAQNRHALLGSILRLDVGPTGAYRTPPDNPYRGVGGAPEVWAKGLRNPWRFSFDRDTGDLYVGDVGQNQWEEIDRLAWPTEGGANFGWNAFEGTHRYSYTTIPAAPPIGPIAEYSHDDGCSVTGGVVLRGPSAPAHHGSYVYGDYCSGKLWLLRGEGGAWVSTLAIETDARIVSFGEDGGGDALLVDAGGRILKLVDG